MTNWRGTAYVLLLGDRVIGPYSYGTCAYLQSEHFPTAKIVKCEQVSIPMNGKGKKYRQKRG